MNSFNAFSNAPSVAALVAALAAKLDKAGGTMTGALAFSGTTHVGLKPVQLTTTQRDALTPVAGDGPIWNSTTGRHEFRNASGWTSFVRLGGDTMTGALTTDCSGLATTPVAALTAHNSTAAALGAEQVSPSISLVGQGWNNISNASHPVEWAAHTLPVQGNPVTSRLLLRHRVNNGSWVTSLQLFSPNDPAGEAMRLSSQYGSCSLSIGGSGDTRMSTLSSTGWGSFQIDNGGGNPVILTAAATGRLQLGASSASPAAQTLSGASGTGTNVVGGKMCLAPGQSTGNATPAVLALQGTSAGSSGTTAQTLVDVLSIIRAGVVRITGIPTSSAGLSTGDIWSDAGTLKIV